MARTTGEVAAEQLRRRRMEMTVPRSVVEGVKRKPFSFKFRGEDIAETDARFPFLRGVLLQKHGHKRKK